MALPMALDGMRGEPILPRYPAKWHPVDQRLVDRMAVIRGADCARARHASLPRGQSTNPPLKVGSRLARVKPLLSLGRAGEVCVPSKGHEILSALCAGQRQENRLQELAMELDEGEDALRQLTQLVQSLLWCQAAQSRIVALVLGSFISIIGSEAIVSVLSS